jgi:hypothetical protein
VGGAEPLEVLGEVGLEHVDALVRPEHDVAILGPQVGMEVGAPRAGEEDVLRALLNAGRQDKESDDETGESEGPEGGLPSKD